jgi:hypothetical protein
MFLTLADVLDDWSPFSTIRDPSRAEMVPGVQEPAKKMMI